MIEYLSGRPSPTLARALAELQARAYASIGIRPWTATEIEELTASPPVHLIVAHDRQGAIQGFLCLSLVDDEGEILSLAVDPDHRRRGIASRLFDVLYTNEKTVKIRRLLLEVAETNTEALALYQMLGFVDVAIRRDYYRIGGNRVDARFMERHHRV